MPDNIVREAIYLQRQPTRCTQKWRARSHKNFRTTAIAVINETSSSRNKEEKRRGKTIAREVSHASTVTKRVLRERMEEGRERWGNARHVVVAERYAGSHTLITRMLYACWWDTYVWALVSKLRREGIYEYRGTGAPREQVHRIVPAPRLVWM